MNFDTSHNGNNKNEYTKIKMNRSLLYIIFWKNLIKKQ